MKKIFLLLLFVPVLAYGQIIETFEQGNAVNWIQGTAEHWKADSAGSINGKFSMHHVFDNPASGSDYTGVPLADLHPEEGVTRWQFKIRHGYDPSSSNNWAVYLMADADPASFYNGTSANGFAVGVNLAGYDDTLRIWKTENGSVSVVLASGVNWQNDIGTGEAAEIRAERSAEGKWSISVFDSADTLINSATGADNELFSPCWFIVSYKYSSTRDRLLWFDDVKINGVFYRDTVPPEIVDCRVMGRNLLKLEFNEEISDFIPDDPLNAVTEIKCITNTYFLLKFKDQFINKKENNLKIKLLCDRQGNCTGNVEVSFTPAWAEAGDVIISEIMADPLPVVGLPAKEYIEITNRSEFSLDLDGWRYSAGDQAVLIPDIKIDPGKYIILCYVSDTVLFGAYGRATGLKPFPSLTDSGKKILLSDTLGNLIHGVEYSSGWYGNSLKASGGWSLEIIDMGFPFFAAGNWEASSSSWGGTPGSANSGLRTNPDILFSGIINVFPSDSVTVSLQLSETVFNLADNAGRIAIDNENVTAVFIQDPLLREFRLQSPRVLVPGQVYKIHLSDEVADAAGNPPLRKRFSFGIPEQAAKGDVVFNELLFNPLPEDPDYIEFYNCSEKVIDASRLYLASISETGDTSGPYLVSEVPRCFIPGTFSTATTDPLKVIERYPASDGESIYEAGFLPSMPDDRGHLLLLNRELEVIDEVIYSEEMHYPLLAGSEGISLEKIRPEAGSAVSMNWHSASESSGWGTPGKENSVYSTVPKQDDEVMFSSRRISPDNDGYEDVLVIDMNLEGPGNVVTISVFNETGGFISRIAENMLAGNHATVVWDGTYINGSLVDTGIYIILIELFNDKGKTRSWKKVCAVVR